MKSKRIDWEERHFQICLALLSRHTTDSYGFTERPDLKDTIAVADRMVELLQQHNQQQSATEENKAQIDESALHRKAY